MERGEGLGTTQELFDFFYDDIPADDPFWDVVIGDPGIPDLFDGAVYVRGAMTLQALRNEVGDPDFFRILRTWAARKAGGNGTTASSSRSPSASRASSWSAVRRLAVHRRKPTSIAGDGHDRPSPRTAWAGRRRRRQRPACSSAWRTERYTRGGNREYAVTGDDK